MNKQVLILCPHPDDEIFVFPVVNSDLIGKAKISALFFIESKVRRKEAQQSCLRKNWEALFISDFGYSFTDSLVHINYENLNNVLLKIFNDYAIILSPLIEGGHQDHDTIGFCTVMNAKYLRDRKIYFYPTYTSFGQYGLFSIMASNTYSNKVFTRIKRNFTHYPLESFYHMFFIYKSQLKSWLLVLLPYIFNLVQKRPAQLYILKTNSFSSKNKLLKKLKGRPLYEIHKRCKQNIWKYHLTLN